MAKLNRTYFGCRVIQRKNKDTTAFFVFYARSKDVIQWAGIKRSEDFPEGTQRILRESRRRAIMRFLRAEGINTIPNNILLAFEPRKAKFGSLKSKVKGCLTNVDVQNGCGNQLEWGTLKFSFDNKKPDHMRPALIVDGQHRLYGISDFAEEDLPVLVVSLIEAPILEQAFQFIVINNKAVRVPAENAKSIIANLDEEEALQRRLLKAGVKYGDKTPFLANVNDLPSSPFQNLLKWDYNRDGTKLVDLTTVEQATRYIQVIFARYLEGDEDSLTEMFFAIWRAVAANYPELWGNDNKFMSKVSLMAYNEFLVERLKGAHAFDVVDIFDSKDVERTVSSIVRQIPKEFWESEWAIKLQDNTNMRRLIKEDLDRITENVKLKAPWSEDLQLLEAPSETA
jgi:DGQHR domain-containing protein